MKYLVLKLFYIVLFLGTYSNCYAEYTYVYCANDKWDWKWLLDDNDLYLSVVGYWRVVWLSDDIYIKYFELSNGKEEYIRLKDRCLKKFGKEYNIVQPAKWKYHDWWPFLVENSYITNGNFFIYKVAKEVDIFSTPDVDKIFLKNIYPLDDPNYNFLSFKDLKSMCLHSIDECW